MKIAPRRTRPASWTRAKRPTSTCRPISLAFLQIKFQTLKQIDDALARLQRGLYGTCVECGDEIPAARLRALPFAVRCLDCEDDREALEKRAHASQRRTAPFQGILDNVS
jgi:RNA polymerase-binding transcription factor DksA